MSETEPDIVTIPDGICDLYHIFRSPRRCYTIQLLATHDKQTLRVRDLAKAITACEQDVSIDQATGDPYENVYTALLQTHLPTLAEADIIRYDAERNTGVAAGPAFDAALLVLAVTQTTFETLQGRRLRSDGNPTPSMTD